MQKKLLKMLLVQDVAKGDTSVLEHIVEEVNEAEKPGYMKLEFFLHFNEFKKVLLFSK